MKQTRNPLAPNKSSIQLGASNARLRAEALQSVSADFARLYEVIAQALSDRSPIVRITAIEVLPNCGEKSALSIIVKGLNDPNSEVRMRAAEALGILSSNGTIPKSLIGLLSDKDVLVRVAAAESLGLVGNPRAVPALRHSLHDKSSLVRRYVAGAIGKIGDKQDVDLLKTTLNREQDDIARIGILEALYVLGEQKILPALLTMLTEPKDYRARCAAANALAQLSLNGSDKQTAVKSLRRALRSERTVATRSSIKTSLAMLSTDSNSV